MRTFVGALLVLGAFTSVVHMPTAEANGCTPCQCGIHICQDGAEFVPEIRNVSAVRGDNVVNVTWVAAFQRISGNLTPNQTFGMDSTISYDRLPHHDEMGKYVPTSGSYPFRRTDLNLSFPGTHTVAIIWPNEEPLYFSMSHGWWITESKEHLVPADVPVATVTSEGVANGIPFILALIAAFVLCSLRNRKP